MYTYQHIYTQTFSWVNMFRHTCVALFRKKIKQTIPWWWQGVHTIDFQILLGTNWGLSFSWTLLTGSLFWGSRCCRHRYLSHQTGSHTEWHSGEGQPIYEYYLNKNKIIYLIFCASFYHLLHKAMTASRTQTMSQNSKRSLILFFTIWMISDSLDFDELLTMAFNAHFSCYLPKLFIVSLMSSRIKKIPIAEMEERI